MGMMNLSRILLGMTPTLLNMDIPLNDLPISPDKLFRAGSVFGNYFVNSIVEGYLLDIGLNAPRVFRDMD